MNIQTKKATRFFILFLFIGTFHSVKAQQSRIKSDFNADWKFFKGDVNQGEAVSFNDASWHNVTLPHDWSIDGPFNEKWASATAYLPGGIGWYRKTFKLKKNIKNKRVAIYFDGVYKNSEVWINGHFLGKRPNGFISFEYDLTPYLHKTGKNTIAVRVNHSQFADSRWYTGSGINRNVSLIAVEPIHVKQWGVAFSTPKVSKESASAMAKISVQNETSKTEEVTIKATLTDMENKVISSSQTKIKTAKNSIAESAISLIIKNPKLWSVDDPNLYQLTIKTYVTGKETDKYTDEVGIRSFYFDADKGFFLNGESLKLKGVCLHDDAGALGTAVPAEVWERRLEKLKEGGCNAIRMSHNPHADYFYKLADRLGFLVMDEAFDEWETGKNKWISGWNVGTPGRDGYHEYFKDWADKDLRDMMLRNRNRPSIIMWSIGNEIDYPNDPYSDPILNTGKNPQIYGKGYLSDHPAAKRLGEISKDLVNVAKSVDTTRPITAALAGVVMSNTTSYPENLDIVGYNYQEYRYQEDHKKYPKRIIYGSENGMSLGAWLAVEDNPFVSGQFLWTGVDYLGEANKWPTRSNGAGLLDLAGNPKPIFYFRKSLWTSNPTISLAVTDAPIDPIKHQVNYAKLKASWNWDPRKTVHVVGFTNCDAAELFLNGKSLGKKLQTPERIIFWDVLYEPGELLVKAFHNGKTVTNTLKSAGKPTRIQTHIFKSKFQKNIEMAQIELQLVDEKGTPTNNDDREVSVQVSGAGKLAGLESGSSTSHEDYKSNKRETLNGKLLIFVKSAQQSGPIKVTLTSAGLPVKTIKL
ncbi:beta-galactosidase [Pedobacter sp. UYP30]|uniref:sugar-binding domain-containing protein n=1 Tax=Pedobacter sp. UYP30 TaxID=1756400 RepID=UPI0033945DD8